MFLGLKLLTCEMKASTDAKDIERYDTLCDVNMSCMAAVDILNDLLCYEKLDSGILILHKEKVTVLPFITECVSMFSVQARECGVAMIVSPGVSVDDIGTSEDNGALTSHPLMSHDAIFIDKFKMDQVIRNLISNALKFTPRGGIVTVDVSFVESHPTTSHQITNGADVRKYLPHTEPHAGSHSKLRFQSKSQLQSSPIRGVNESGKIRRLSTTQNVNETWGESDPSSVDGKLVLVVTDTGAGISPENQNKLFKDIVQFSPEKLQAGGGSGLGLWISSGIVDLHEGRISVRSDGEGMGSSFTVEIPMLRSCEGTLQEQYSIKNGEEVRGARNAHSVGSHKDSFISFPLSSYCSLSGAATPTDGMSTRGVSFDVLVVDDSRLNRKMLMKFLQKGGHRCTEAEDGLEAIEVVKERIDFSNGGRGKPYDAILMDFIMPNMDGPTAVKEIRSMGYVAPIFGLTGNGRTLISLSFHASQISSLVFFRCNTSNIQFAKNINERKCSSSDSSLA